MRPTRSPTSPAREDGVQIRDVTGQVTRVDRVVIATHADQALGLLTDPSDAEVTTLKQFGYSRNLTVLHTDSSVLPDAARARAMLELPDDVLPPARPARRGDVLDEPAPGTPSRRRTFLVTLNDRERLDPESIVATMDYEHPIYTPEAVRAQSRLSSLATGRTVYAGAYHGWGFHEDGCRSGVEAARHFGVTW